MDVLRALSSPNMDIRKKTLDIALDLITARNIDEVRRLFGLPHPESGAEQHVEPPAACGPAPKLKLMMS